MRIKYPYNIEFAVSHMLESRVAKLMRPGFSVIKTFKNYYTDSRYDSEEELLDFFTEFERDMVKEITSDSWLDDAQFFILALLTKLITEQYRENQNIIDKLTGGSFKIPSYDWQYNKLRLIEEFKDQLRDKISTFIRESKQIVTTGMEKGTKPSVISSQLSDKFNSLVSSKMRFIARNLVGNFFSFVNKTIQSNLLGIDTYVWATVGDEKVRDIHRTLDGKICSWSNPFIMSNDGIIWEPRSGDMETGKHPGEPYNCRCSPVMYVGNSIKEIDKIIRSK